MTVLSPSSLEFEFDAKRLDRTGYEVMKTERDVLISELRGLGVNIMDWGTRHVTVDSTCRCERILRRRLNG